MNRYLIYSSFILVQALLTTQTGKRTKQTFTLLCNFTYQTNRNGFFFLEHDVLPQNYVSLNQREINI